MTSSEVSDPAFVDMPSILVDPDRLIEFFPKESMSPAERLNALARLALYSSVLWSLYNGTAQPMRTGIVLVAVLAVLWKYQTVHSITQKVEAMTPMGPNGVYEDGPMPTLGAPPPRSVVVENAPCQMPTKENPFMNTLAYDGVEKLPACRGPGVQQMAENMLNSQLYADPRDLFGKKQMQRQFVTLPSTTVPNDREKWANWLYKDAVTCKTNPDACAPLDDLRRNKVLPVDYVREPDLL